VDESADKHGLLPRFTLKDGNSFLLTDALGDIHSADEGFFSNDTRMLSRLELAIAGRAPSLLGAAIDRDNTLFTAHLTNRPLTAPGELALPHGVIHLERCHLLCDERVSMRIRLTNFGEQSAYLPLVLQFAADFADIFEVQGRVRKLRGSFLEPEIAERGVLLAYLGRDQLTRRTWISFDPQPLVLDAVHAEFRIGLARDATTEIHIEIGPTTRKPSKERFTAGVRSLSKSMGARLQQGARIRSSGRLFNRWVDKSHADLALLTTLLPTGPYPYAGIPWFATQFGRDAIITALQTLWMNPALAAGVLTFLAATQATEESAFRDSQPGKIMHETRRGEMAALQEVPFGKYYGGVDTTPLFVMLAGAYEMRTGDRELTDSIWGSLLAATAWIESRLAVSRTGFLDYARGEASGLANQAWKDSQDSIFHADGSFPKGPLAVLEVQGYGCAALEAMARMAMRRGMQARSERWMQQARQLREAIEERFWIPQMSYYALALDGEGEPCRVYASNAGHLLYCGVPDAERAGLVAARLLSPSFSSGWGIRTLAIGEARYNPMSYHNGSIWPHDTSICVAGMSRYGARAEGVRILNDIFETAISFNMRLPELYCGFERVEGQGPAPYPVACLPQAWASGAVFLLLQSVLGLAVDGERREVHITRPMLPDGIESLTISDLAVRDEQITLEFRRIGDQVVVAPDRPAAGLRILVHL
jgi:glycogen debranching enzyme